MTSILVMIWTIRKSERNPYVAPGLEETKSSEEAGASSTKIYSTSIAEKWL